MDAIFNQEGAGAPMEATPVADVAVESNSKKKARETMLKNSFKQTLAEKPDFEQRLRKFSNSLKVVNTLGYSKSGNIVLDKEATNKSGKRSMSPASATCGYAVQNIGTEPIPYRTEIFKQNEQGVYEGQVVEKVFDPGTTIYLTREYMTAMCAIPEISFTLSNGAMVKSSKKNPRDLKEELESYFFAFSKDSSGNRPQVNDDEIKILVDDGTHVKPEFAETFGYLDNPKEKRGRSKSTSKFTTADLNANYINKLLQEQGNM